AVPPGVPLQAGHLLPVRAAGRRAPGQRAGAAGQGRPGRRPADRARVGPLVRPLGTAARLIALLFRPAQRGAGRDGQEERVREGLVVVALGGNAISPPGTASPIPAQYEATMETAHHLAHLTERPLVVTHGNGPQVGNALLRSDLAAGVAPPPPLDTRVAHPHGARGLLLPRPRPAGGAPRLPLDPCVADLQGGMGFMLQQCLDNAFIQAGVRRSTVTVVTRTVVDAGDPAFRSPSKQIGP